MGSRAQRAAGSARVANLALRFALEVCALAALGFWGWSQTEAPWRYVLMLGVPALAAAVWATFTVPDDPSRSGRAPVPVPGSHASESSFPFSALPAGRSTTPTRRSRASPWPSSSPSTTRSPTSASAGYSASVRPGEPWSSVLTNWPDSHSAAVSSVQRVDPRSGRYTCPQLGAARSPASHPDAPDPDCAQHPTRHRPAPDLPDAHAFKLGRARLPRPAAQLAAATERLRSPSAARLGR